MVPKMSKVCFVFHFFFKLCVAQRLPKKEIQTLSPSCMLGFIFDRTSLTQSTLKITKSAFRMLASLFFKYHGYQLLFFAESQPRLLTPQFALMKTQRSDDSLCLVRSFQLIFSMQMLNPCKKKKIQLTAFTLS